MLVEHGGVVVGDSRRALRVLETSQPPAWYLAPDDVRVDLLVASPSRPTTCEWKGTATYVDLIDEATGAVVVHDAGWTYATPRPGFEALAGLLAFYAQRLERCSVDGEVVVASEGSYYGGWVTHEVVGPFKGGPGTLHW